MRFNYTILKWNNQYFFLKRILFIILKFVFESDSHTLPTNHRQKVFSNGTLIIQEVNRMSDAGYYSCIVTNRQGQAAQRAVHLSVLSKFCHYIVVRSISSIFLS